MIFFLLSLAPQPSLGLGLHKIRLNFLEASQQISFYRVGLLAPRQTPIPEDQVSVFISPRGRVATHFSLLLRHAWVTLGCYDHELIICDGKARNYQLIKFLNSILIELNDYDQEISCYSGNLICKSFNM